MWVKVTKYVGNNLPNVEDLHTWINAGVYIAGAQAGNVSYPNTV
jgi:hypothetical protein